MASQNDLTANKILLEMNQIQTNETNNEQQSDADDEING
jgi:hypothetical protein